VRHRLPRRQSCSRRLDELNRPSVPAFCLSQREHRYSSQTAVECLSGRRLRCHVEVNRDAARKASCLTSVEPERGCPAGRGPRSSNSRLLIAGSRLRRLQSRLRSAEIGGYETYSRKGCNARWAARDGGDVLEG
jgi:hypothetical protein